MAPTRSFNPDLPPKKTLAKRKAEADAVYYRELEEIAFKVQLGFLGDDLLDTPPPFYEPLPLATCAEAYYRIEPMQFEYSDGAEEWGDGTVTEVESEGEVEYVGSAPTHKWQWGQEVVVIPNNGWVEVVEIY